MCQPEGSGFTDPVLTIPACLSCRLWRLMRPCLCLHRHRRWLHAGKQNPAICVACCAKAPAAGQQHVSIVTPVCYLAAS